MGKLNRYNQRLLAIIGTLALVGLFLIIAGIVYEFVSSELRSNRQRNLRNNGVVIDQNQVIDTSAFTFTQQISILQPYQLDSTKPVFIIPIGHKNQKSKRFSIAQADGRLISSYTTTSDYYYSNFSGLYNNFVLIDYTREIKMPVFKSKVAITDWAYMKIDSTQLILFKGTNKDLNEDGQLNKEDFQSLFILNVKTVKIRELSFENQTVREFSPLNKTSKIYVRTGRDIDKNNFFDYGTEPTDLYFYDVTTGENETLVPDSVKLIIQNILNR